jgi:coenzyme F420-reducing hydrogenase delta subunit
VQEKDPVQEGLSVRRQVLGSKIIEQTIAEADTSALEAENKRLEQEIRREQLRAERSPQTPASDAYVTLLTDQLNRLQDQLSEANQRASEAEKEKLNDRLQMLTEELQRLGQPKEQVNVFDQTKEHIESARSLIELLTPSSTPPPPEDKGASPELSAWMLRSKLDHQKWEAERADRHAEQMAQIAANTTLEQEKLRVEREKAERMDRFLTETAPKVVEVASQVLQAFTKGGSLLGNASAGMPAAAAQVASPVQNGVEQAHCQSCNHIMTFNPKLPQIQCNTCGAIYSLEKEQGSTEQTEQYEQPQEEMRMPVQVTTDEEESIV